MAEQPGWAEALTPKNSRTGTHHSYSEDAADTTLLAPEVSEAVEVEVHFSQKRERSVLPQYFQPQT